MASLIMTIAVFTFVLMVGSALKEILPLLVNGQVGFGVVTEAFGLLIPFVWVLALPMGMLTATLLIFGRFSADQELTAVRASGISLLSISSPILLLSLVLCGFSALVNMEIGPRCRVAYRSILFNLRMELSNIQLPEGRFIRDFKNYLFYVDKNRRGDLEKITVYQLENETNVVRTIRAEHGKIEVDTPNQQIHVYLYGCKVLASVNDRLFPGSSDEIYIPLKIDKQARHLETKVSDMSFTELRREYHTLERQSSPPIVLQKLPPGERKAARERWAKERKDLLSPVIFHMHRQIAFSFACFGFTLVGIPLAIRVHRRETNVGIALALILVVFYYSFIVLGQSLDSRPECAPYLIVWVPNFLFQAMGAVLLWRANKGI
jgi:lipopolysaccharide export system permease protein